MRQRAAGLARHDVEAHSCGLHPSIAGRLGKLAFEDDFCPVCAKRDAYQRFLSEQDEEWEKAHPNADPKEPRPGDGRSTRLRPLTEAELAEVERRRRG
jgi:hypothetical protein